MNLNTITKRPLEQISNSEGIELVHAPLESDLPEGVGLETLALFLHETMKPWHDTVSDVMRGLQYALAEDPHRSGFTLLAMDGQTPVGAVVILETGMGGYVPENLLLFIAVSPKLRGKGIGGQLLSRAADLCRGNVCLHVEPDNPAKRLYERSGFKNKYLEMRLEKS